MITHYIKNRLATLLCCGIAAAMVGCQDLLETESSRQNIEPEITAKTDSVFYSFGILQAMQQLADQYVFQGEMRGDLVQTTLYTDNNLRQLANFSATTACKYDSAYVYYRVINNCNYYIAHRDTTLYTGSTNVVMPEYIGVKAIRAWAYLQLGRNYERVPFFTEPLTKISQIDNNQFPELDLDGLVAALAPDLEQYSGRRTPDYGVNDVGAPNWENTQKRMVTSKCFVPVDVVLGDMYLETGNYHLAATHYVTYLTRVAGKTSSDFLATMTSRRQGGGRFSGGQADEDDLPDSNTFSDPNNGPLSSSWSSIFRNAISDEVITYIPMAVNRQNGAITELPLTFGFNYYATAEENAEQGLREPYIDQIQLLPSETLNTLSDSTEYYYYFDNKSADLYDSISISKAGDMRLRNSLYQALREDTTTLWIDKYKYANVVLYRTSTVLLHLAEAFNRLDMPDAAFAILKDGISPNLVEPRPSGGYYCLYITDATRQKLQTTYPLLSPENGVLFPVIDAFGIHCHGAGKGASDYPGVSAANKPGGTNYHAGSSPYQLDRMAGLKMKELADVYGITVGTTRQDTINAVEDLICDEYALELAFEGNRFYDLCRLARHKNQAALYGGNFGSLWLARKLAYKNPVKDLTDPKNWFLPFK